MQVGVWGGQLRGSPVSGALEPASVRFLVSKMGTMTALSLRRFRGVTWRRDGRCVEKCHKHSSAKSSQQEQTCGRRELPRAGPALSPDARVCGRPAPGRGPA